MTSWKYKLTSLILCLLLVACTRVNERNFDKITSDMSFEEVVTILGDPTSTSEIGLGNLSTTTAVWESKDAKIVIQFFNNKVKIKNYNSKEEQHIEIQ